MPGYRTVTWAAIVAGLSFGALSAIGRAHLDGTLDAFVNSTSTWLVAPFLVGSLAATRRGAAAAGFGTCAAQLVGYYVVADLRVAGRRPRSWPSGPPAEWSAGRCSGSRDGSGARASRG